MAIKLLLISTMTAKHLLQSCPPTMPSPTDNLAERVVLGICNQSKESPKLQMVQALLRRVLGVGSSRMQLLRRNPN